MTNELTIEGFQRWVRAVLQGMYERDSESARLTAELEKCREDTARLDWLALHPRGAEIVMDGQTQPCIFWGLSSAPNNTLREAIDAARGSP